MKRISYSYSRLPPEIIQQASWLYLWLSLSLLAERGIPESWSTYGALDAEGGLDVLVQSKKNKHAALKLMRELLRIYGFVPETFVTDDLRSYRAAARDLGMLAQVDGASIGRRVRIS